MSTIELWCESIKKIKGVKYVKIKGEVDKLQSIHIVTNGTKSPKQLVRDIEAVLLAMFDYQIDHKIISIAELDLDEQKAFERIKYEGIYVKIDNPYIECEIQLSHKEERFTFTQKGLKTALNRYVTVAKGTVGCLGEILEDKYFFDILDVQVHHSKSIEFISVVIQLIGSGQDEVLIGTAIIRDDPYEAVVKATLDGINRKILV